MSSQDDFQSPKQPTAPARTVRPPILDESDSSDDDVPLSTFKRNTSPQKAAPAASSKPPKKVKKEKKHKKDKKSKKSKKRKKDVKRERSAPPKKRARASSAKKAPAKKKGPKEKTLTDTMQLDRAMKAYRWWEATPLPDGQMWQTLEHYGVNFPPKYVPHGVKMGYDGAAIDLTSAQEEVATFYAEMPLDGPQLGNPKTKKVFDKNFFKDFKGVLGRGHAIQKFDLCDFGPIRKHVEKRRKVRKERTKEEKEVEKKERMAVAQKYAYAMVDDHIEKLGNYTIEPSGLFRGRGAHPKTGTLKTRVMPEQVILNVGDGQIVPRCHVPGHAWGSLIEKNDVTWLAYWHENVMNGTKYVWLAASSSFKGKSDVSKYEKARKLKKCIGKIRGDYEKNLKAKNQAKAQRATAMWIIDRLALRAGNEKGEDEADTVGTCSLRKEHLAFDESGKGGNSKHVVVLDFLGKDSMRHFQTIDLGKRYGDVGVRVFNNLQKFCKKKKGSEDIFDQLSVSDLNDHLKTLMPGLSAKVFRTFNASATLEAELPDNVAAKSIAEKVILYNEANRKVAILCNHQKTVSNAFEAGYEKLEARAKLLREQIEEIKSDFKRVKKGKDIKLSTVQPGDSKEERAKQAHRFKRQPSQDQVKKRFLTFKQRLTALELNMKNKDDNKSVALGTSKINYMDPRITVAWCKRNECPIDKVFARALRDKFPWACSAKTGYKF
jgi:DNA topoisomerase-1